MPRFCLISVTALGLFGSLLCRADIVVNYGPPPDCPPCEIGTSGQPDLVNPGAPGPAQQFTLTSAVDITGINFWAYEEPDVSSYPVSWSILNASSAVVGSGTVTDPGQGTPTAADLGDGFDLQVNEFTFDLPTTLSIAPGPGPETYTLNLKFLVPTNQQGDTLFWWAEGTNDQVAFQLLGSDNSDGPNDPVVPEPSYLGLVAGGLGILMVFRIRKKR